MKLFSPAVCCNTVFKSLSTLSEPLASDAERVAFPLVARRVASPDFATVASMSILSKSKCSESSSSWVNPVSEKSLKSRGRPPRAPNELLVADWAGVDLEDPQGANIDEKAISARGNCVGASTLASRGYRRGRGYGGVLGWWELGILKKRIHLKPLKTSLKRGARC
jgi:hypothetical protein